MVTKRMRSLLSVFSLGSLLLLSSCNVAEETAPTAPAPEVPASPVETAPESGANVFDPSQVEAGDEVAGLEIQSVDVNWFEAYNGYVGTVQFQGETTVTGTYEQLYTPEENLESFPCFRVNAEAASQLPRFEGDQRNPWFCFSNAEAAQQALGDVEELPNQTIVIDNFQYVYMPSDVFNSATFVEIVE